MDIHILGSGGWIPTSERQTSAYLVREGEEALILDAGTGLGELHRNPDLLRGIESVTIALSHFHLDHIAGLTYFSSRWTEGREVTIIGPGRMSYGSNTRDIVEGQFVASPVQTRSPLSSVRWLEMGVPYEFAGHNVEFWTQTKHTLPSAGMRVGDTFAYCTDTEHDENTPLRVRGVDTLLHEAWEPDPCEGGHTSGKEVADIAEKAGAGRLVLTHLSPLHGIPDAVLREARAGFPFVELAEDGNSIYF